MSIFSYLKSKFLLGSIAILFLIFGNFVPSASAQSPVTDFANLVPNGTSAVSDGTTAVMTTLEKIQHYILDPFAWFVAKKMVDRLTVQTVNWINSGFEGNPAYVTEPGQFFLDLGDDAASKFLSDTNLNQLCTPFKAEVRLALVKSYISEDSQNYSCTLSKIKDNYDQFTQDFSVGGWEGWFEVTQVSENNPYGAFLAAKAGLNTAVATEKDKYQKQLEQGKGFLSFETCPKGQSVTQQEANEFGESNPESPQLVVGDCKVKKETSTPGSVIESQLEGQLGSGVRQLELADSFNEIVGALVTNLVKKVTGGGAEGEIGLRNVGSVDKGFVAPPDDDPYAPMIIFPQGNPLYVKNDIKASALNAAIKPIAVDSVDGDISDKVKRVSGIVIAKINGTYPLTFTVTNSRRVSTTTTLLVIVNKEGTEPTEDVTSPSDDAGNTPGGSVDCKSDGAGGFTCTLPPTGNGGTGSGGGSTGGGSCSAGNDGGTAVPPPIASDLSNVVIDGYNLDIRNWPVSSSVTLNSVTFPNGTSATGDFCLNHPMPWGWPSQSSFAPNVPATGWVFVWRNGAWHGATFEYYYDTGSQAQCRAMDSVWSNNQISGGFSPKPGETYGFMLSGIARGAGASGTAQERSNVVMQTWQGAQCTGAGGTGSSGGSGDTGGSTGGTGGGSTAGGAPSISSITPTSAEAGITIVIYGSNLTSTVQFFDSTGARNTVTGVVNSSGTQVTTAVPGGMATGAGTVRVYASATSVSNLIPIQITSGSGGGTTVPNVTATVNSTTATTGNGGALAFNPTNNNWLVVSALGNNVYARVMNNDGTATASEFVVNSGNNTQSMNPKVAWDPNISKFLVVWITFDPGTIYGRFINADGTPSGNVFSIFKDNQPSGYSFLYANSLLQYDPVNKKFAFTWEYRTPRLNSNLITISETGVPGSLVQITTDSTSTTAADGAPAMAVNTATGEYCIAYSSYTPVGASGWVRTIRMKKYNPVTGVLGPATIVDTKNSPSENGSPTIVYNSIGNKFMVGWNVGPTATSQARILNSCSGTDGGSAFTSNSAGGTQSISYNRNSNTYASIVQDQNDSGNTYIIMNASGVLIRKGIAFAGGFGNFTPMIMPNTVDGKFGVTSALQYNPTRFAGGL